MSIKNKIMQSFLVLAAAALLTACETGPQVKKEAVVTQATAAVQAAKPAGPVMPAGVSVISVKDLQALVDKGAGDYLLFDSRPAGRFHAATIPGSQHLTDAEMEKLDQAGNVASRLGTDKNKQIIFWCGGPTCPFSIKAAGLAAKNGYTNVKVFSGGDPAWAKADLPFVSSPKFVKDDNILLIDLRSAEKFAAGHIPRALSLPVDKLDDYEESNWPSYKGAAIVFYSDNQADIDKALETMLDFGLTKATFFPGGIAKWQQLGNQLETGANPAPENLTFERKLGPNDITIADFDKALNNKDVVILDVRNDAERTTGSFKNALHVPSDQIGARYQEIPKDKQVIVHCATGLRAGIAFETLKAKGITNVKVLNANVKFEDDGTVKITE